MTHATDPNNNESLVSHTTPKAGVPQEAYALQHTMKQAILRYVNKGVSEQVLLSMVVASCYQLPDTIAYLGKPAHPNDMGYSLRLHMVRSVISTALRYYTYGREIPQ